MLRNRSDVLEAFKNYKRRAERQTGRHIKKLRTDNGREYLSKEFDKFLEDEGITRQLTVEYTPQQNGVAERANRTLVEMARCLMLQASFTDSLWAEAVNTATHLRNRSATSCLDGITPFEAWTNRVPCVTYLRIIGSKAIVLNKGPKKGKFRPKGEEYVLVGYSSESKAYRLWKPGTKTVIKSRDVKFIERMELPEVSTRSTLPIFEPNLENRDPPAEKRDPVAEKREVSSEEDDSSDDQEARGQSSRGRGRPKFVRTGKPGRPKKVYQTKKQRTPDPETATEAMKRDDGEL